MNIPPLNPLKVFEVVARTSNLTQAAIELRVSQSAVSRQIAVLEEYLGVQLFTRERIGVKLTEVGKSYAQKIAPAFEQISQATVWVTRKYFDNCIRLRTYTTLTGCWLIPRLPRFKARYPDVEVRISNSTAPLNFSSEQCDLAIVFGDGRWPGTEATLLLEDVLDPVCAPALLKSEQADASIKKALFGKRLLVSEYRKNDWPIWLSYVGMSEVFEQAEKMTFSSSVLAWQAAVDGLGIAIGQTRILGPNILSSRLVCPFSRPFKTGNGHYLVAPSVHRYSSKIAAFKNWLIDEARQTQTLV